MSKKIALNKGKIRDNALKALLHSNLFQHRTERNKKGKGSYHRPSAKQWQRDGSQDTVSFFACMVSRRSVDKPGSVVDSHSSRHAVADAFQQPTRTRCGPHHGVLFGLAPNGV